MNYLDKILDRYNHSVDDEYEREILHQSSSIALHLLAYSMIVVGAILAWVIPGPASLWSMLVFWPVIVCSVIASAWMKKRAPRPRSITFLGSEIAFMVVVMAVWLGGVWVNAFEAHPASGFGLIGGGVVGAIVGGVAAGVALKRRARRMSSASKRGTTLRISSSVARKLPRLRLRIRFRKFHHA